MDNEKIKRCKRCGLPQTYPGIKFDEQLVCNYCAYYKVYKEREEDIKAELNEQFIKLIRKTKRQRNKYDCIVAYSGGKDSTFLLHVIKKKFGLNILAHTLDNGFISSTTVENIKAVTKNLGVDYRVTKLEPPVLKEVFTYALTETIPYPKEILALCSPLCAVCIGMVLGSTINLAVKLKIPVMFVGFTPGQYPGISLENFRKVKSCIFLSDKVYRDDPLDILKILADPVREKFGGKVNKYYFRSQYYPRGLFVPKALFPFHAFLDYDEKKILKEISKLGWVKPKDTDTCSTNCLLNTAGNYACMKQLGYHPYIGELAYLVRTGKMLRREAIAAEKIEEDSSAMRVSLEKLGLEKNNLGRR